MLEIKNTNRKEECFDALITGLDTAEERIKELKDRRIAYP